MGQIFGLVYKIANDINGKVYIGQTITSLDKRFKEHCRSSAKMSICRAIKKYGRENFTASLLAECHSKEEMDQVEVEYINSFGSIKNGYNIRSGGSRGSFGDSSLIKLKESFKANKSHAHLYKAVSQYSLDGTLLGSFESIAAAAIATGIDKKHIHRSCRAIKIEKARGFLWAYAGSELAPTSQGRNFGKPVIQMNREGHVIAEFVSACAASRSSGFKRANIASCCRGNPRHRSVGGFIWKFKE